MKNNNCLKALLLTTWMLLSIEAIAEECVPSVRVCVPKRDSTPLNSNVFTIVDSMPTFPGGQQAMSRYIIEHLQLSRIDETVAGAVWVRFIVREDGSISDVKVLRKLEPNCDAESIRVVRGMPNWIPGVHKGKKVAVSYTLPFRFFIGCG